MDPILQVVEGHHASNDVRAYCLYMHYFQRLPVTKLAVLFNKSARTIQLWIEQCNKTGDFHRKEREKTYRNFGEDKRKWIVDLYLKEPTTYIHEAKDQFRNRYQVYISLSSIWVILKEAGLTYKVLERRALNICMADINRFSLEMLAFDWNTSRLVFIDEAGFDNRDGLRTRGFGIKGSALYIHIPSQPLRIARS